MSQDLESPLIQYLQSKRNQLKISCSNVEEDTLKAFDEVCAMLFKAYKKINELQKQIPKDPKKTSTIKEPKPVVKVNTKKKKK